MVLSAVLRLDDVHIIAFSCDLKVQKHADYIAQLGVLSVRDVISPQPDL
jgi:hypothetical protein